ncbi:MAG TPA: DUF4124 domain-containing protein [Candidatus Aquabacterium excrementipullorum]|nr:DUF4124 domain-containing protein [Candidatus Aquabacterium excrementipullorum]
MPKHPTATIAQLVGLTCAVHMASAAHAEVYKWVDDKGQTHYGERKPDAGSTVSKVKIRPSPSAVPPSPPPPRKPEDWLEPSPKPTAQAPSPPAEQARKSRSNGRENGTDESRCALARDILDGNLRHANGNPIDKHDLDTARSDVRLFCKSR